MAFGDLVESWGLWQLCPRLLASIIRRLNTTDHWLFQSCVSFFYSVTYLRVKSTHKTIIASVFTSPHKIQKHKPISSSWHKHWFPSDDSSQAVQASPEPSTGHTLELSLLECHCKDLGLPRSSGKQMKKTSISFHWIQHGDCANCLNSRLGKLSWWNRESIFTKTWIVCSLLSFAKITGLLGTMKMATSKQRLEMICHSNCLLYCCQK